MKKINTLLLFAFCCFLSQAQISFLMSDMPSAGWTNAEQEDTATGFSINYGNKGPNQVYNFSTFVKQKLDSLYYLAPNATQQTNVPAANLAVTGDHNTYLLGIDTTAYFAFNGLQTVAFGTTVYSNYTQIDTDYKFPTDYGQTFSGTYGGSTKILASSVNSSLHSVFGWDSIKIVNSTVYYDSIDGWGKVTTPVGTYNCLRQHRVERGTTTLYYNTSSGGSYTLMPTSILGTTILASNPILDTTDTYYYLTKEAHGSVINFTYDSIHQLITASWSTAPPFPVANFGYTTGAGGSVNFSDSSTNATSYSWTFGDGSPADTTVNANHIYSSDTTFVVCLTVTNSSGSDTKCDTIRITDAVGPKPPVAVTDTASVVQPGSVTINVIANDTNFNSPDTICVTNVWGTPSGWETVSGCSDVTFHALDSSFTGLDTFYYRSCDTHYPTLCDTGMVIIDVLPAPAPPVASFTYQNVSCTGVTFVSHSTNADTLSWTLSELYTGSYDTTIGNVALVAIPAGTNNFVNVTYLVCLTATTAGQTSQVCDTVYFGCAGINEINTSSIRIYPNPASDQIQLDLSHLGQTTMDELSEVVVYDMLGQKLKAQPITESSISVRELSNGVYLIGVADKAQNVKILGKFDVLK